MIAAHDRIVRDYLRAKDAQQPHLWPRVFSADGRFRSRFDFDTDFGDEAPRIGHDAITEVFRRLGGFCENIVTVCPIDSVIDAPGRMQSRWLVAMSERCTGQVRVAWGDYDWTFDEDAQRATSLEVRMMEMAELPPESVEAVMGWLEALPHPWCDARQLIDTAPRLPGLEGMAAALAPIDAPAAKPAHHQAM